MVVWIVPVATKSNNPVSHTTQGNSHANFPSAALPALTKTHQETSPPLATTLDSVHDSHLDFDSLARELTASYRYYWTNP